jgi:hypothetical protein
LLTQQTICPELTTELANSLTQKKIINKLAKVNKPCSTYLLSTTYKGPILPLVKPAYNVVNKIIDVIRPGSTVAQIYIQGYNRGIGCNMHPVSFSLLRFFWTSKRNEEKASRVLLVNYCFQIINIPASNPFVQNFISISKHQNGTESHYIRKITNMQPAQTFAFFSTFTTCNIINKTGYGVSIVKR